MRKRIWTWFSGKKIVFRRLDRVVVIVLWSLYIDGCACAAIVVRIEHNS